MKCYFLFLLCHSLFLSNVAALALLVQSATPSVGLITPVSWSKQSSDPSELEFDIRFVRDGVVDVGLAAASIFADTEDVSGQVDVVFPRPGTYTLVAVTGPRNINIGRSNQVEAIAPVSTTSRAPSPTDTVLSGDSTPCISEPPQPVSGAKPDVNVPIIVGAIVGTIIFVGFLVALFIYLQQRRQAALNEATRRISFHKDLMVQTRTPDADLEGGIITPYPFITSPSIQQPPPALRPLPKPFDLENECPKYSASLSFAEPSDSPRRMPPAHLGTGHIVPPPRGPRERASPSSRSTSGNSSNPERKRRSIKYLPRDSTPEVSSSEESVMPTTRQQQILSRMTQIRRQMAELQRHPHPGPNTQIVLSNMQRQLSWLAETKESPWALGDTDVRPPGYARHMTP